MTSVRLIASTAFALLSVGTLSLATGAAAQSTTVAPATEQAETMMAACPMNVPGTKVSAVDSANAETLVFTTTDDVAALRTRVHRMAEMHNQHHVDGGTHGGMMGGGMMGGGMMGSGKGMEGKVKMPPSNATVTDVDSGASIALTPLASADLPQLQAAVRAHATRMQQNGCGRMAQKGREP
jgi:hypothetical protein